MSASVPVAFAEKFRDDFIMLSQQRTSRLERTVRDDPDVLNGRFGYFERIGATEAQEALGRHADTPLISTPHSRRRIGMRDFDWADLIDRKDMRRIISAGQLPGKYRMNAVMAFNRKKDDLIIEAATGNATSIDANNTATLVPLPAAQIIASSAAGLTISKLREAKEILDGNEVDEEEQRFAIVSAKQISDLLNTTEVTSSDFNTVKTLVEGKIDTYLGFTFIRSERLLLNGSTERRCLFYARNAMGIAKDDDDIGVDISPRRDKRNSTQVYVDMSMDATRVEDEKMVEVACVET